MLKTRKEIFPSTTTQKQKLGRHLLNLLNLEFPWNHDDLPNEPAVHGPPVFITEEIICNAISQMKKEKATGPSGVVLEMILASQQHPATSDKAWK